MPKNTEWSDDEIRIIMDVIHTRHGTRHRCDRPQFGERKGCGGYHLAVGSNLASRTAVRVWHRFQNWVGFGVTAMIILFLMLLLGFVLLAALWVTDVGWDVKVGSFDLKRPSWLQPYGADWLHSHAYIPNILAGVTGFLIGAPVAAVFLARFTIEREEKAALERVNRLSQLAWYTFRDAVFAFCTQERIEALQHQAPVVEKAHDEAFKALQDFIAYIQSKQDIYAPDALEARIDAIKAATYPFETLVNRLTITVKDSGTIEAEWSAVVGAWNTLDQYVRLQRLERYLEWFDPKIDADIRRWMTRPKNPLQEFTDIHGFAGGSTHSAETMVDAAGAMHWYINYDENKRRDVHFATSGVFGHSSVSGYNARYREASSFLGGLLGSVCNVEFANWPESASKPVKETNLKFEKSTPRWLGSLSTPEGMAATVADMERLQAEKRSEDRAQSS